jgi:ActR/RegA family two-component response regulator
MASYDEVKLEDILHGSFATFNPNTGANKDADSLPSLIVYEEGSSTALTVTSSVTNITTGRYRWQVTIEASAGFEAGKYYEVWISATVTGTDTVSQVAPVTSFKATARVVDDVATATNVSDAQTAIITQVDANETKIDAIKAKTDNLPSDPADQSAVEAAITAATSPLATAANLATVAGYLDTEIAAILADTNELQSDWADGGRLDLILDARASQTSVDDLPTNAELATALGTADDAVLAAIATVQSDTNDIQTRLPAALESGRIAAALDSAATAAVADAVLTESILDHRNVAHSLAKYIWQIRQANLTIDGTVSNAITPTTLTFSSNVVATTSAYAHAVLLFTTGPLAGENSPIISYNSTNGVFVLEEPLTAAPSNGDEFVVIAGSHVHSVADIQSGLASQASVNTLTSYVDTEVAAIKAKTDNLPSDPADQSLVEAAITAATTGLSTLTSAQVNAEVLDVLSVDNFAELAAPPAANSSLKDKITWLFMYARNKVTQTALARTLYRDDTTTVAGTSATSDNGTTFTKGEDA